MVIELVEQARRRFWWNEILAQGAWATSAGMAAFVLLLLLGTQVLDWVWLVIIPAATFGAGVYRAVRRLPSGYAVAQLIDSRLNFADSLSTAYYFDGAPGHYSEDTCAAQRAQAEQLCDQVSVRQAVPFTMPKAVYATVALFATAGSLFALRYGLEQRLDLQRPMLAILQQAMGFDQQRQLAEAKKKKQDWPKRNRLDEMASLSVPAEEQAGRLGSEQNAALDTSGQPETAEQKKSREQRAQNMTAGENGEGDEWDLGEEGAEGLSTGSEDGSAGKQAPATGKQEGQDGKESSQAGNSSLMSKFKEAMQNLLSRMKPPAGSSGQGQQQSAKNQTGKQNSAQPGQRGEGQQGKQQSGQQGEAQEGQGGQDAQMSQSAQAQAQGQDGEQQDSNQPGSGIGRQDGSKDVKLAEQLAAMGKISELIGKRSASVSGEVTVEVQNSNRQLQTPYAQRGARHGETTAEISRDEIPVALQPYVEQYFEQVRKQPQPARGRN
ncbi:MAG: hypothetical protein ACE15B_24070 [Bryobacteraceae bacterium]